MRCYLCQPWRQCHVGKFQRLKLAAVVSFVLLVFVHCTKYVWPEEELEYLYFSYPLERNISNSVFQLMSHLDPEIQPINRKMNEFVIPNAKKCINSGDKIHIDLLLIVKSAVNNFEQRNAIRHTWGSEVRFAHVVVRRVFNLGVLMDSAFIQQEIQNEQQLHSDIVQSDFVDSYYNNTFKTTMGFRWAIEYCPNAKFVMFVDDDMYVSIKNILQFVTNPYKYPNEPVPYNFPRTEQRPFPLILNFQDESFNETSPYFFAGYVKINDRPFRNKYSKWYVSTSEYPFNFYPPYVPAGAFILSFSTAEIMYYTSMYTQPFRYDDVYLGITAKKAGIKPFHNYNFQFWGTPTDYKNLLVVHDFGNSSDLIAVWKKQLAFQYA